MASIKRRLCSSRGETFLETMVAILLVSLISAGLASMIMGANKINNMVENNDRELHDAVNRVENSFSGTTGDPMLDVEDPPDKVPGEEEESNMTVQVGNARGIGAKFVPKFNNPLRVHYYTDHEKSVTVYVKEVDAP